MSLLSRFKNVAKSESYKMIQDRGNGFYSWNGKLYQSDVVRACIKPKTKAIGKAVAKHIRDTTNKDGTHTLAVNPEPYIRFLLEEPNPYMTGQMMQEKVANQLALNNNAFILIVRDDFGYPCGLYPIPCVSVETKYINNDLYLRFWYANGKSGTFPYTEIIHLRDDYHDNDIFGEEPGAALTDLMQCVKTMDQGFIKAIKNSGVVRWLLKYTTPLRPEDLKKNVQEFSDNYLSVESSTFGAAGTDAKADAQRIEPKDYVPNAANMDRITERIYAFFNTNKKIVTSDYTEDQWNAYYEAVVEPVVVQMSNEFTRRLFTRRERGFGNKIVFESSNLLYANLSTKLAMVSMVDRGALTPNEWRALINLAPIDGGDVPIRRLDTAQVKETDVKEGEADNENSQSNRSNHTQ